MCLSNRHGEGVTFDCTVIGAGIQASPERLTLFEKIINVVHMLAPQSRIAFSRTPADTAEAAQRWIKRGDWVCRSSFASGPACQNAAPKSQPRNPRGGIFRHRVEERTGKNVSAAKKIACDRMKRAGNSGEI
jgi:hypothetical protein